MHRQMSNAATPGSNTGLNRRLFGYMTTCKKRQTGGTVFKTAGHESPRYAKLNEIAAGEPRRQSAGATPEKLPLACGKGFVKISCFSWSRLIACPSESHRCRQRLNGLVSVHIRGGEHTA